MLNKLFIVLTVILISVSTSFAGPGVNIKEGKWEITTQTEMPGMPANMSQMKHTFTQCLTKKDLVPQSSQPQQSGQECKITQMKVRGNTVTWTMICKSQGGETKATGKVTYSGDSFKGTMKMTMPQGNMIVTSRMSGRRIGDCK